MKHFRRILTSLLLAATTAHAADGAPHARVQERHRPLFQTY
jgi:hypothetical protein